MIFRGGVSHIPYTVSKYSQVFHCSDDRDGLIEANQQDQDISAKAQAQAQSRDAGYVRCIRKLALDPG